MTKEYTHELQVEYRSISGRYEPEKEGKIRVDGKEVLYVVGNAVVDSFCCGHHVGTVVRENYENYISMRRVRERKITISQ